VSNLREMTISRVENACKPLILLGLQKNIKIISTHLLTVLIISVILQLEQRKRDTKRGKEENLRYPEAFPFQRNR
jgi:hypothetical protein